MTSITSRPTARREADLALAFALNEDPWTRRVLDQERAEADLETGSHIRATLLEPSRCGDSAQLAWASSSRASRGVGGAFHDIVPRPSGGLDVILGADSGMGNSIEAALWGATRLNETLRAMAALGPMGRPLDILMEVGRRFKGAEPGPCASGLAFIRVDGAPMVLSLANAAHVRVAIRSLDGSVFEPSTASERPGESDLQPRELVTALAPGDLVLLFTHELAALARKRCRIFNVAAWLGDCEAEAPADVAAALGAEIERWCPKAEPPDKNVTFVAISVNPDLLF